VVVLVISDPVRANPVLGVLIDQSLGHHRSLSGDLLGHLEVSLFLSGTLHRALLACSARYDLRPDPQST
jgi:hypothetical protein